MDTFMLFYLYLPTRKCQGVGSRVFTLWKIYFILLVQLQLFLLLIKTSKIQTSSSVIAFLNLPLIITFSKAVSKIRKAETNGKLDFSLN